MLVSVIVCTYSPKMMNHCLDCIESILNQTYDDVEIVCVVDGNRKYYEDLKKVIRNDVRLFVNERNLGLLESRNRGVKLANGDVVAFIDDDAVADKRWVEELVRMYEEHDALAAGGKMKPMWLVKKPKWFPEEFYWLIGVTYAGFPERVCEVRNTFGSNLSFRRDVFIELGGFNVAMGGIKGKRMLQGGETDLCMRLYKKYGRMVVYNPNAVVYHKIFERRTKISFLIKRAFWQGYSKAVMKRLGGDIREERGYLNYLLLESVPRRIINAIRGNESAVNLAKVGISLILTASVGFGYCLGKTLNKTHAIYNW